MDREELRRAVSERLDGRQLVYFGTRGDDAEGVGDLRELSAVFSVVGSSRRAGVQSLSLEEITGRRVDLDAHDIDDDPRSPAVIQLRRAMLRTLSHESVVFTYRPSTFLSAICFARDDRCTYAGMFKDHQAAFEHKPWVESSVRRLGIDAIPWAYLADEDQLQSSRYLDSGAVMLRRSRSSGGAGLTRVETAADLAAAWPEQDEIFVSVAPYIDGGIPTNVSAVVWDDGVTLHAPSVQLIGIPECTSRPFGYCGNDFGAVRELPPHIIEQMEVATRRIGRWMQSLGFRGAFGVDFLVSEDRALFTEINPRLQGVTHLACQLSASVGQSCVMLEHLGALLGLPAPPSISLADHVASTGDVAHLVLHWMGGEPGNVDGEHLNDQLLEWPDVTRVDVTCSETTRLDPGATLARATIHDRLTASGFELIEPWAGRVHEISSVNGRTT